MLNWKLITKRYVSKALIPGSILLIVAAIGCLYWQVRITTNKNNQISSIKKQIDLLNVKVNSLVTPKSNSASNNKSSTPPSYSLGDTQTEGNLTIRLSKTYSLTQSQLAWPLPPNTMLFGINLSVTNNSNAPINEVTGNGLTKYSTIYTQIGNDASTGKYYLPETSNVSAGCIGNNLTIINPEQTINTCLQFAIPSNVTVSAYFYDQLKWNL